MPPLVCRLEDGGSKLLIYIGNYIVESQSNYSVLSTFLWCSQHCNYQYWHTMLLFVPELSVELLYECWYGYYIYAPKKSGVQWSYFCGLKLFHGQKSVIDRTVWEQCCTEVKCVWVDWQVKKNSSTSITDRILPGQPWTATTDENIRYFCPKILNKRRLTVYEVADHLQQTKLT
jgi:hypothetical protein